jgi:hypothetical protein
MNETGRDVASIILEEIWQRISDPLQLQEIVFTILAELMVRSPSLSERKGWYLVSSLTHAVAAKKSMPSREDLLALRGAASEAFRNREIRTSDQLWSLKLFELGERAVREFLERHAWDGMPGFEDQEDSQSRKSRRLKLRSRK